MNLFRKLALSGIGLAFVLGLAVTESNAQRSGRYYGDRSYGGRGYVRSRPTFSISFSTGRSYGRNYNSYYGGRSYRRNYNGYGRRYNSYYGGRSYNRGRYGLSWRERRILAIRRARAIRAVNRYQRTRSRILNRASYRNSYYNNW
jgi:hypothetical protein